MKNCVFKPNVNTIEWLKAAGVRAVKTMAQTALGTIGADAACPLRGTDAWYCG